MRRRRRGRGRGRGLRRQHVHGFALDRPVERHLVDPLPPLEETSQSARIDDRAREEMRARRLSFFEDRDRDLAEPVADLRGALEQLAESDRARQTGGAGANDQYAHVDPLLLRVRRRGHVVTRAERRRKISGFHALLRCLTSSVSFGTTWWTVPTTPRSENSKIGAFGSLLIAMITPEACMPTLCWIAPEMPHAMYSFGDTVFPVWPT